MDVVLASGNPGKVKELQTALQPLGITLVPQTEFRLTEAVEDAPTFIENALKKARHACAGTGMPSFADDSGLEVDALQGAPGVYSARYAARANSGSNDQANIAHLLAELSRVGADALSERSARFRCALVYLRHADDPAPIIAEGVWEGHIALSESGSGGFGYDPVFVPLSHSCTAAELDSDVKRSISHRAQAVATLRQRLSAHT